MQLLNAPFQCTYVVREKKTFEPRCCMNTAVKDGLCNAHHPDARKRRMAQALQYWTTNKRRSDHDNETQ